MLEVALYSRGHRLLIDLQPMSQQYKFSVDVLKSLQSVYGSDLERVVEALKTPGKRYYFRANTIKASLDEVVERFERRGLSVKKHQVIKEALYLDIEGPFEIPIYKQKIVVDKFAAESVLQGAHIYAPGVVKCQKIIVTVKSPSWTIKENRSHQA
jgi:16S rRNA C967 or C1407 C5-methylase (RsmB/RsmF family)